MKMMNQNSLGLRVFIIMLIGVLVVGGCSGSLSLDGGLDFDGEGGGGDDGGGSTISQNQLLVVLIIILLVVALAGILR